MPRLRVIQGEPSWSIENPTVQAHLTRLGGHLGPIVFRLGRREVTPLSVAPWAGERIPLSIKPLLRVLRGDFFCAPFGDNTTPWRGEKHPSHGEAAQAVWSCLDLTRQGPATTLHARLRTTVRAGTIDKRITLIDGHAAVYQRHTLAFKGPMNFGHHAMVKFPEALGSGILTTSRLTRRQVFPGNFGHPEKGSYQSLKPGAVFRSLRRAPLWIGGHADLTRYPARSGFDDAVLLTADVRLPMAWNAVTFPAERYVWFSLRDPRVLRHTLLWISNGGSHFPPWNGRHRRVMGIEDITSYFQYGLAESVAPNPLNRRGVPTAFHFRPDRPVEVATIMAVAEIPAGFDEVAGIRPVAGGVELRSAAGPRVRCAVDCAFLAQNRALR